MKIIVIGSPGSGKSVFTRKLKQVLKYPVLHLDSIYHKGGKSHISSSELLEKINDFSNANANWIIDGNYISTMETRVELADTIFLLNIPVNKCLENIYNRANDSLVHGIKRDDMADGFDETLTDDFVDFVRNFKNETFPKIEFILKKYNEKHVKTFDSYKQIDDYIESLKVNLDI